MICVAQAMASAMGDRSSSEGFTCLRPWKIPDSVDAVTPIKVDAYARRTGCSVSERYAFHAVQSIVPQPPIVPQPRRPKQFIATHGSGQSTVPRIRVFFHKVAARRNPFDSIGLGDEQILATWTARQAPSSLCQAGPRAAPHREESPSQQNGLTPAGRKRSRARRILIRRKLRNRNRLQRFRETSY